MTRALARLVSGPVAVFAAGLLAAQGLPPVPFPTGNPPTVNKALLGKALFWDEQLSSSKTVACGTCHLPSGGGSDPRTFASPQESMHPGADGLFGGPDDVGGSLGLPRIDPAGRYLGSVFGLGVQVGPRRSMSVVMAAYSPTLFWDGRAPSAFVDPVTNQVLLPASAALESQALLPFLNEVEMGHVGRTVTDLVDRVTNSVPLAMASNIPGPLAAFVAGRTYPQLFGLAFGTAVVTPARIAMAIATYERELVPDRTPFDLGTLSPIARLGEQVFNGVGRCNVCHAPPLFTDHNFVNLGVRPIAEDLGRSIVTGLPADRGAFRMPSLRNVALRGPFDHNGRLRTLDDVVAFYDRGGDFPPATPAITPLFLGAQQKRDLIAFLVELTDPRVAQGLPPFDRPTLWSESAFAPRTIGTASPGDGGALPRAIAVEPAILGTSRWTLALERATPGVPVWMLLSTGADPIGLNVFGAQLHVTPGPGLVGFVAGFTSGTTPGTGTLTLDLIVPADPSLHGLTMFGQWWVLNVAHQNPFSATAAFSFSLMR
ncbi:MAG: hypothetical protein HZB39_01475 [Planctomycetes bacterium]|nr:hypothetical protein [Planctomycetota bacterium]